MAQDNLAIKLLADNKRVIPLLFRTKHLWTVNITLMNQNFIFANSFVASDNFLLRDPCR